MVKGVIGYCRELTIIALNWHSVNLPYKYPCLYLYTDATLGFNERNLSVQ